MDDRDALLARIYARGDRLRRRRRALLAATAVVVAGCIGLAVVASASSGRNGLSVELRPKDGTSPPTTAAVVPNRRPPWPCDPADPTPSLRPTGPLPPPGAMPAGSFMQQIQRRGLLAVGVEENAPGFGYRAPSGGISGLDVDLAREVARAIFGDPNAIRFRALSSAQRIAAVADGEVDIVASLLSITCPRWQQVDFTAQYYGANQAVLVRADSTIRSVHDLNGQKVCATVGSTSMLNIKKLAPDAQIVPVALRTDCLAALEQGTVDAITNDDTILAGFQTQTPFPTRLLPEQLEHEPYGMAIATSHPDFVQFVNAVLEKLQTSGRWTQLVNKHIVTTLHLPAQWTPPKYRT